jgi:uncharacterized protein with PQ loop repeat
LGVFGTVLAALFLAPQIVRLLGSRDASGISMTWAGLGLLTNLAWVLYLASRDLWLPSLAPAGAIVMYGLMVMVIRSVDGGARWRPTVTYGAILGITPMLGGWPALGVVLILTPSIQLIPAVAEVYAHPRPFGISPLTWGLALAEAICWGMYGYLVRDVALVGYGVVSSLGSILILWRRWGVSPGRSQMSRVRSATSTKPSLIAVAAASPRLAALSLRRMFET